MQSRNCTSQVKSEEKLRGELTGFVPIGEANQHEVREI
jgi:hypothetical protein